MPTFTFTNNNGFDVYFYSVTQPGTLRGWGSVTERERTKTFVLDLPAGTELHFTTKMTMDLSSHGPAVYHDSGITFDAYRTTGADRQTHTIRDVSTSFYIRNSSTPPIFLFTVDPRSGNEVAAGSLAPNGNNASVDAQGALKPRLEYNLAHQGRSRSCPQNLRNDGCKLSRDRNHSYYTRYDG